jgi:hypothetical protein
MNISESMVYVLKNRSSSLFSSFWKTDLRLVFRDVKNDFKDILSSSKNVFKTIKHQSVKETLKDVKDSTMDAVTVFKVVPGRIRQGLLYFRDDLIHEMEVLSEQKQKTIFCIKVIAVLSSFTLNTLYGVRQTKNHLQFRGFKFKNALTHMVATEILVRVTQVFIVRLLNEMEAQVEDVEERKKIASFKSIISSGAPLDSHPDFDLTPSEGDRAMAVVEAFKTFIMTGQRVTP